MGSENHTIRTDKEREALNLNQKEDRLLTKSLTTLNLEKSYVLKILNLERKQIKFGQKRLRDKVKLIRTHLDPDDIASMKTMEVEGKFKPEYTPMNASGLIRILAASKRLKLMTNDEIAQLVEKDLSRPLTTECTTVTSLSRPVTPAANLRMRSHSVPRDLNLSSSESSASRYETKKFPVVSKQRPDCRFDSLDDLQSANRLIRGPRHNSETVNDETTKDETAKGEKDETDGTRVASAASQSSERRKQAHALTTRGFLTARPSETNPRHRANAPHSARLPTRYPVRTPRTARPKTSLGIQSLNYSSHKLRVNTEGRCRRESVLSTSSIGSEIAREKAAEFRKELLNDEQLHGVSIEDKRQTFLTRIQHWVKDNPSVTETMSPRCRSRSPSKMLDLRDEMNRSNNCNELDEVTPQDTTSQDMTSRQWASMKKIRYLRIDDAEADLSGVTTLVRDQMRQLRGLRAGRPLPLAT